VVDIDRHEESILDPRRRTLSMILVGVMALIMVRLFVLQVVRHDYYTKLSFSNQLQRERIIAPRGIIRARDGSKLVVNMPIFQISVLPNRAVKRRELLGLACRWLKLDPSKIQSDLDAWIKRYPDGREMIVVQAADKEQISVLRENQELLSFFKLDIEQRRYFPEGMLAAHVFGYVGEVTDEELARSEDLVQGDILGRTGIELAYEKYLRGMDGVRIVGISVEGTHVGEVSALMDEDEIERLGGARPSVPGDDIYLTVDLNVQRAAETAFTWERGALVAMDPRSGEILAAVSRPTYDPNMFIEGVSDEKWKQLFEDPSRAMFNRIVQAQYPPGSVFKLVTAYAALTNGRISEHGYQRPCFGGLQFGNRYFKCWQKKGHGALQLDMAIVQSCDVFFYQEDGSRSPERGARSGSRSGVPRPPVRKAGLVQGAAPQLLDRAGGDPHDPYPALRPRGAIRERRKENPSAHREKDYRSRWKGRIHCEERRGAQSRNRPERAGIHPGGDAGRRGERTGNGQGRGDSRDFGRGQDGNRPEPARSGSRHLHRIRSCRGSGHLHRNRDGKRGARRFHGCAHREPGVFRLLQPARGHGCGGCPDLRRGEIATWGRDTFMISTG
jgi:hypothetical protein